MDIIQFMTWPSLHIDTDLSVFSPDTLVSSINKSDRHDITEILLKVALNTITLIIDMSTQPFTQKLYLNLFGLYSFVTRLSLHIDKLIQNLYFILIKDLRNDIYKKISDNRVC